MVVEYNFAGKMIFFLVLILSLTTVGIHSIEHQYPIVFVVFLFFLIFSGKVRFNLFSFWAFCIFFIWLYGVSIGILRSNNPVGIVRNFAGMVLYLPFAVMLSASNLRFNNIVSFYNTAAILYAPIAIYFTITDFREFGDFELLGLSAFRIYFSIGILVYFPSIALFLYGVIFKDSKFQSWIIVFNTLLGFLFLVVSSSKGFLLSFLIIGFTISLAAFFKISRTFKVSRRHLQLLAVLIISIVLLLPTIVDFSKVLIDLESDANHPRVIQSKELIQSFSVTGIGLGGVLESGYIRDELGYGMELSYHSIISKFGVIVGIFAVFFVLLPLILSMYRLVFSPKPRYAFAFGCSSYLIAAWGNPFIFAPPLVFMSCISFWLVMCRND